MTPTIYGFTRALIAPQEAFATLLDAHPVCNAAGQPRIYRTARFAEVQIEYQGAQWLLCMPLTPSALPGVERIAAHLKTLRSEWLADYRLLRDEMSFRDSTGTAHRCDLVLQRLPSGRPFTEALVSEQPDTLLAALDALEGELQRLDLSHRNLKAENLLFCNGRLIPIRHHYAIKGFGADTEALEALRIEALRAGGGQAGDVQAPFDAPTDRFPGHVWVGNIFEQMVCIEDQGGFGYVDTANRPVIAAQYLWADDFHEGRAAVQTTEGMGLIDKTGRQVIPARYEIVEYLPDTGCSRVRHNNLWADFDYEGRQLTDFSDNVC